MNKAELISAVADATKLTKTDIGTVLDSILETIETSLKKKNDVSLVGFGSWNRKSRAARTGRNPQTGAAIKIAAKNTVTFSAGKALKDSVN
jgi:nucleoid DNA-binding protein